MEICPVCGAEMNTTCRFASPETEAPWIDDYLFMSVGEMTHEEHQLMVARWNLHHRDEVSDKVQAWARGVIEHYKMRCA